MINQDSELSNHRGHKVLGRYCWNCQVSTIAGTPGWPSPSKNDARPYREDWAPQGFEVSQNPFRNVSYVRWQDGSLDPYKESYRETGHFRAPNEAD